MELQRQYLVRLVAFSRNRDVTPLALSDDDRLASNADVVVWQRIISELNRYRHPESRTLTTEVRDNQDASINKLIDASNSLIGIINETELNNIKKSIAQKLGVDDEYVAINADRTFYGEESSTLELKKSIVFPPVNAGGSRRSRPSPTCRNGLYSRRCAVFSIRSLEETCCWVSTTTVMPRGLMPIYPN